MSFFFGYGAYLYVPILSALEHIYYGLFLETMVKHIQLLYKWMVSIDFPWSASHGIRQLPS